MNYIKKRIKAVIFDMDGTVIDTEHIWEDATKIFLNALDLDPSQDFLESLSGCNLEVCAVELQKGFGLKMSAIDIVKEHQKIVKELFKSEINFINGFKEFHKELKNHLILTGLATNADDMTLTHFKKHLGLSQYFDKHMYNASHVDNKHKPDPAMFLHTANMLEVHPKECIIFEDSLPGFEAAKAANIKCIAIKNPKNELHRSLAHGAIESYHEAIERLKEIL